METTILLSEIDLIRIFSQLAILLLERETDYYYKISLASITKGPPTWLPYGCTLIFQQGLRSSAIISWKLLFILSNIL